MSITPADVKLRFPEFNATLDARIQLFIDDAVLYLNETRAGLYYNKLLALLTAHYLALADHTESGRSMAKGTPTSYTVQDTSISFATRNMSSSDVSYFTQTAYGVEFLTYLTYTGAGGLIV